MEGGTRVRSKVKDTGIRARVEQVRMMRVAEIKVASVGEVWREGETRKGLRLSKDGTIKALSHSEESDENYCIAAICDVL